MQQTYDIPIGPSVVLAAENISDPFASWTEIGATIGSLTAHPEMGRSFGGHDLLGITPEKGRSYHLGAVPAVDFKMAKHDIDILASVMPWVIAGTTTAAVGLRGPNMTIKEMALAIVPVTEYTTGLPWWDSEHCLWLPSTLLQVDSLRPIRVPGGSETIEGYSVKAVGLTSSPTMYYGDLRDFDLRPIGVLFDWQAGIDGLTPKIGEGAGSFTRNSEAWYIDAGGTLQKALANVRRIQDSGLLLEPQRTNLLTYSEQFDNAQWVKGEATISANAATSPDGAATADKLVEAVAGTYHYVYNQFSATSGSTYTVTVFAKADDRSWLAIVFDASNGVFAADYSYFDLANGVLGTIDADVTASIEDMGNGWYRCRCTRDALATDTGRILLMLADSNESPTYSGDGASGLYLWGADVELGSYPTSYIPTEGASVTRSADILNLPFTQAWGTGFTVHIKATMKTAIGGISQMMKIGGPSTAGEYGSDGLDHLSGGTIRFVMTADGGAETTPETSTTFGIDDAVDITVQFGPTNGIIFAVDTQEESVPLNDIPGAAYQPDSAKGVYPIGNTAWICEAIIIVKTALTPAQIRKLIRS